MRGSEDEGVWKGGGDEEWGGGGEGKGMRVGVRERGEEDKQPPASLSAFI